MVHWCRPRSEFDHALIIARPQHYTAGSGFAGASRPDDNGIPTSRNRIDLRKLLANLSEWQRYSEESLIAMEDEHQRLPNPPDPYEALKQGELILVSTAQAIAPKRIRRPGETRQSFCFEGHRVLNREINLL